MRIRIHSPDYQSILTSSATLPLSAYDSYIHYRLYRYMKPSKLCMRTSGTDPDPDSGVFWIRIRVFQNDYYDYDDYDDYDYDYGIRVQ